MPGIETTAIHSRSKRCPGLIYTEEGELIYSAPIVYSGKNDWIYEQVYVFCPTDQAICP